MCGRFIQTSPAEVIAEIFGVDPPLDLAARYNIAPGQDVAVVRRAARSRGTREGPSPDPVGSKDAASEGSVAEAPRPRELVLLRWGLVPHWAKELPREARTINARAETAAERPSFRDALRRRRCLVPADGFYEWQAQGKVKQPFWIGMRNRRPFAMAGLWERWRSPDGRRIDSCTILTTEANELVRPLHDRMPAILPRSAWDLWLDPAAHGPEELRPLLRPFAADPMETFAVSRHVNDPRNDDPACIEPVSEGRGATRSLFDVPDA